KKEERKSVLRLLKNIEKESNVDILNIDSNLGILGIVLADYFPNSRVLMTDSSARAINLSKINANSNDIKNVKTELISRVKNLKESSFDIVSFCPKPYEPNDIVKQKILEGCRKLKEGGKFYLSANINEGANVYVNHIKKLLNNCKVLDKESGNIVVEGIKKGKIDYKENLKEYKFEEEIKGINCEFTSTEGLFSPKELDHGTRFLIKNIEIKDGGKILDLACGYGPLGIFASKMGKDNVIYFTDDDAVSIKYTKKNMKLNEVNGSKTFVGDCLEPVNDIKFDKILCNPPTHSGKGIIYELLEDSYKSLRNDGCIYLVYNKSLNYERKLRNIYNVVRIINENNQFKVCKAIKD
ncbi:MAG: methyltransferase, partial [Candidatus Aenigmatarchaeota archaeon]